MQLLRTWLLAALLSWLAIGHALAASYTIPQALTSAPFNCTFSSGAYDCPAISLSQQTNLYLTQSTTINVNGDFLAGHHLTISGTGKLTLVVAGNFRLSLQSDVDMDLTVAGTGTMEHHTSLTGNVTISGNFYVDHHSLIDGNVVVTGNMTLGNRSYVTGTCTVGGAIKPASCGAATPVAKLHHIQIVHDATGLTCAPSTITIRACASADSGGSCTAYAEGVSGTIRATNGSVQDIDFDIPDDSSQTTIALSQATPGIVTLSSPDLTYTCWNGTSNSCQMEFEQAGFVFTDIPNHWAGVQQNSTISALSTKPGGKVCAPTYTQEAPVTFRCTYVNPTSGSSITLAFNGKPAEMFACGTDKTINVPFNASGQAAFSLTYPDAGNITLTAFVGSNMSGQDSFIAAPASFKLAVADNPVQAGKSFPVIVQAMTAQANVVAKSFGKESTPESVQLGYKRCQPSAAHPNGGGTPSDGVFTSTSAAFTNGSATYSAKWTEVGNLDLTARLASNNYLGSGLAPTGILPPSTSACGSTNGALTSVPHHFKTATGQPVYTYSGQPMKVIVTGQTEDNQTTSNYYIPPSGTSAVRPLTLSAWNGATENPGPGLWDSTSLALSDLSNETTAGAVSFTRTYTLANKLTAPVDATIRVRDDYATSEGFGAGVETVTNIRNGRLRLSNAFGSAKQSLYVPVTAQYWSGNTWILNTDDNSTQVPASSIALTQNGISGSTASLQPSFAAGRGTILVTKPTSGTSGTVDIALNLGSTATDVSCLAVHPLSTGSAQHWLRHTFGSCASPADPSARATFGVYPGQTKRTIYVREAFN